MRGMRSRKNGVGGSPYAVRRRCAKGGIAAPNKFSFRAEMKKMKRGEGERVNVSGAAKRHGRGVRPFARKVASVQLFVSYICADSYGLLF